MNYGVGIMIQLCSLFRRHAVSLQKAHSGAATNLLKSFMIIVTSCSILKLKVDLDDMNDRTRNFT